MAAVLQKLLHPSHQRYVHNFRCVCGNYVHAYLTDHGLRATIESLLTDDGNKGRRIVLRTGYSSTNTLRKCNKLEWK